jgi:hypothetical protein
LESNQIENAEPRELSSKAAGFMYQGGYMKLYGIRKVLLAATTALLALTGAAALASGQYYGSSSRDYQRAQRRAQIECAQYQRTGDRGDYRDCQRAQAEAQRYYLEMQRAGNYNNNYNYGYNNYGYRTPGYTTYRIYRDGSYYNVDSRGVSLLRQAINSGYQQGYQQGRVDRMYGRGFNYYGNSVYMSGMYGYNSYVAQDQYQYYFQQGFQRGYEDGYNNTSRYGYRSGSSFNILSNVLGTILNLATQP